MKREVATLIVCAGVVLAQKGSISGTVRDAVSGQPVAGAQVFGRATGSSVRTTSEADGRYRLTGLDAGTYNLSAYAPAKAGMGFRGSTARAVSVGPSQELTQVDFRVEPNAEIAGRVLDENKEPVQGVQVLLVAREYDSGALRYIFTDAASPDDQGEYRLTRVQPGRAYLVMARKFEWRPLAISDAPADPKTRKRATAPTYYSDTTAIESGLPLVLRRGEEREGVDIRLARTPSFCVEGTAETPAGPAALRVELEPKRPTSGSAGDGGFFTSSPGLQTAADGKFRICAISPGDYTLTVTNSGTPLSYATSAVSVGDKDVTRVKAAAANYVSVAGEIAWDGDPPKEAVSAKPYVGLRALTRAQYRGETRSAQVSIPGTFAYETVLVDEYAVDIRGLPRELYVKDILYGVQSILPQTLRAGSAIGNATLKIVVARDGGTISVKAADKDGNPTPDVNVVILPEDAAATWMITGQADQNGAFTSAALAPGKYYVVATADKVNKSPDCMRRLMDLRLSAKEVAVGANSQNQVTLAPVTLHDQP